ncbi:hypothetical protein JYT97_03370, partial [Haliea sp. AH-315-K21]|nr:hypothetical protein [Haliea sp. AH-315-K21]
FLEKPKHGKPKSKIIKTISFKARSEPILKNVKRNKQLSPMTASIRLNFNLKKQSKKNRRKHISDA